MNATMVRLLADVVRLGASYHKRQRAPRRKAQAVKCTYCGAHGQRIGTRCEYCQVFVSREAQP